MREIPSRTVMAVMVFFTVVVILAFVSIIRDPDISGSDDAANGQFTPVVVLPVDTDIVAAAACARAQSIPSSHQDDSDVCLIHYTGGEFAVERLMRPGLVGGVVFANPNTIVFSTVVAAEQLSTSTRFSKDWGGSFSYYALFSMPVVPDGVGTPQIMAACPRSSSCQQVQTYLRKDAIIYSLATPREELDINGELVLKTAPDQAQVADVVTDRVIIPQLPLSDLREDNKAQSRVDDMFAAQGLQCNPCTGPLLAAGYTFYGGESGLFVETEAGMLTQVSELTISALSVRPQD